MTLADADLNLLKVLDALIEERSVTRAAQRLRRSQPAVSNALRRLRRLLGDDLLVRGPRGLVLTPRAEALHAPLREALALVEGSLSDAAARFNPTSAAGVFRLSTPDRLNLSIVPPLLARLRRVAPNMALQVLTADRSQALDLIDGDRADLALGWFDEKPGHLRTEFMLEERLYCVVRRGHPILARGKRFDMQTVLAFPHVVVSATGQRRAIFDDLLQRRGLRRNALVTVTNFTAVPHLLSGSDMIGVFTALAADVFEGSFKLAKRPVPMEIAKISTHMIWHVRQDRDRRHLWMREQIKAVYRGLKAADLTRGRSDRMVRA